LSEYDSAWTAQFESIAHEVRDQFGDEVIAIEHIGSTSVPGMLAKPVIDVLVGLRHVPPSKDATQRMVAAGFDDMGEYGIADRAYFSRADAHVHCFVPGTGQWDSHLLFRDYLCSLPAARDEYIAAKRQLAEQATWDRELYAERKEDVVARMLVDARDWDAAGRPAV
jgi:GrpB-like predicted nucleotidyltransferase (UPF0157 family)